MATRSYKELSKIDSIEERFEYLKLPGHVGEATFGGNRYLNQKFYRSKEWKRVRDRIIVRDNCCDLGVDGFLLHGCVTIHHINPITDDDLLTNNFTKLLDEDNLICVSADTHRAIHYGIDSIPNFSVIERLPGDTVPWNRKF